MIRAEAHSAPIMSEEHIRKPLSIACSASSEKKGSEEPRKRGGPLTQIHQAAKRQNCVWAE